MISELCVIITLSSAMLAAFIADLRTALLWLWVTGLGMGGIYLSLGAEVLAVLQWVVSTLVAVGSIYYSAMLGEYGEPQPAPGEPKGPAPWRTIIGSAVLPGIVGSGFLVWIYLGSSKQFLKMQESSTVLPPLNLQGLGQTLIGDHILSLSVLGLTLFMILVGGGVLARPDVIRSDDRLGDDFGEKK